MAKRKLAYIWFLRNTMADKVDQYVPYKDEQRYMKSVPESLAGALSQTALGGAYELVGVIYDDDTELPRGQGEIKDYGFVYRPGQRQFYSADLQIQSRALNGLLLSMPSTYRRYPRGTPEHATGKNDFERHLHDALVELDVGVAILDGLLVILDELVCPGAPFARQVMNIHPGVTREDSSYERRGAYATLGALYGARGEKVVDRAAMEKVVTELLYWTGAPSHYMDNGIDSGEVLHDVLRTEISPDDTTPGLCWNNFNNNLFPALHERLVLLTEKLRTRFLQGAQKGRSDIVAPASLTLNQNSRAM